MHVIQANSWDPHSRHRYASANLPAAKANGSLNELKDDGVNPMEQAARLGFFSSTLATSYIPVTEHYLVQHHRCVKTKEIQE